MLEQLVKDYYAHRRLEWPDATQALLFLISELGELAEAFLDASPSLQEEPYEHFTLQKMVALGQRADRIVSGQNDWVRNYDRASGVSDLGDEIGDVLMMLAVFAITNGREVIPSLQAKIAKKGFTAGEEKGA